MGRRGNGEGSIYRRQDGWGAAVSLPSGKRKYFYARTRQEVAKKKRDFEKHLEQGIVFLDRGQTVATFLKSYLSDSAKHSLKATSYESYESIIRVRVIPRIGRVKLVNLTGQHLQALYNDLLKEGLAPSSVVRTHAVLHAAFRQGVQWAVLPSNPADRVRRPRIAQLEMKTLSAGQVRALLDAADDGTMKAIYALASTAGLRRGEILGLKWRDIDLLGGTLSVQRTAQRVVGQGIVFSEPKNAKSNRKVRLAEIAIRELKRHRAEQLERRLQLGSAWIDLDLVFASSLGTPLEETQVHLTYRRTLERAGLPRIRFHDLRHTAATLMLQQNVNPKVVQEMLGHTNIATTLNTYSHVTPDMQAEAVSRLNELFA